MGTKTTPKKRPAADGKAPNFLLVSLLVGIPFLTVTWLKAVLQSQDFTTHVVGMMIVLVQGMGLAFFWRRISDNAMKAALGWIYVITQWAYMVGLTLQGQLAERSLVGYGYDSLLVAGAMAGCGVAGLGFLFLWTREGQWQQKTANFGVLMAAVLLAVFASTRHDNIFDNIPGKVASSTTASDGDDRVVSAQEMDSTAPVNDHGVPSVNEHAAETPSQSQGHDSHQGTKGGDHSQDHGPKSTDNQHGDAHWSYEGETGPRHWGALNPSWELCEYGDEQSPVDFERGSKVLNHHLKVDYRKSVPTIVDNGHTVQVNFAGGNQVTINGKTYELKQFHYHSPSEHTVNGVSYPLELHFVHANAKGNLAVLGVMVEKGQALEEINKVLDNLPAPGEKGGVTPKGINLELTAFYPKAKGTYHYPGSLTTPPCSEGVNWNVFKSPIQMSAEQIDQFKARYSGNSRPVQPLNHRIMGLDNARLMSH